jgi:hypothetical protein
LGGLFVCLFTIRDFRPVFQIVNITIKKMFEFFFAEAAKSRVVQQCFCLFVCCG